METVLLESHSSTEVRSVLQAALVRSPSPLIRRCPIEELAAWRPALARGHCLPVGSVAFLNRCIALAGLVAPAPMSYPAELRPYLHRALLRSTTGVIAGRWFVKPVATKLFAGFVLDTQVEDAHRSTWELGQLRALRALPPSTPVWLSQPVRFICEWRYYVQAGQIIGQARYDPDGPENAPAPDVSVAQECTLALRNCPHPWVLDLGVLSDGRTALVECNDAWAIGLYGGALSPEAYLEFLWQRWRLMVASHAALSPSCAGTSRSTV